MTENERFRKSNSAQKSKYETEINNEDIFADDDCIILESSSSASIRSKRAKLRERIPLENLSIEEPFSSFHLKSREKTNQNVFLRSSVALQELDVLINKYSNLNNRISDDGSIKSFKRSHTYSKLIVYRRELKQLLQERSAILLKEECDICYRRFTKLIQDFKQLYISEKLKIATLPTQTFNRFVSSSDINLSILEILIKKLKSADSLMSSINTNHQRFINMFHLNVDEEMNFIILKINLTLKTLKSDLVFWANKIIDLFIDKLNLADPYSIYPDFLEDIFKKYYIFNSLISQRATNSNSRENQIDNFSSILNNLAIFEARVAAEKTIHCFASTCKKWKQKDLKIKLHSKDKELQRFESGTSDYGTASVSELQSEHCVTAYPYSSKSLNNFSSVLFSVVQRNQSILLKYLYAITNLHSVDSKSQDASEQMEFRPSSRQMWCASKTYFKNDQCIFLEEIYWISFWKNTKKTIVRLLSEAPFLSYGDTAIGSIILWPMSYWEMLLEFLRVTINNDEIPLEGKYIMKELYNDILILRTQITWDKEFSLGLIKTHLNACSPVPTAPDQIRSLPGNLMYVCLDHLMEIFNIDVIFDYNSMQYVTLLCCLQAMLGSYILWISTRSRAAISSLNLATFLLINCSDCNAFSNLLRSKEHIFMSNDIFNISNRNQVLEKHIGKNILKKIDILCSWEEEALTLLHGVFLINFKDNFTNALNNESKSFYSFLRSAKVNPIDVFENLLDLFHFSEILQQLPDVLPSLSAVTSAFSQALILTLKNMQMPLKAHSIQVLSAELSKFLLWLENFKLSCNERQQLKKNIYLQKLKIIFKILKSNSLKRRKCLKRNQIIPISNLDISLDEGILSQDERHQWHTSNSSKTFCLCF